jgi:hypothetical protein
LFAATLLRARKMIEIMDSDKPNMAKQFFIDRAIQEVEFTRRKRKKEGYFLRAGREKCL